MNEHKQILESFKPLFKKAKKHGLWFYCKHLGLWLSPEELKAEQTNGRFLWGAINWELRHPSQKLGQLLDMAHKSQQAVATFKARMSEQQIKENSMCKPEDGN